MNVLLINPPIYDFAAHDFWLKPYGLVHVGGILKVAGLNSFYYFDFMDRHVFPHAKSDRYGRGKFFGIEVEKPGILDFIPRKFKRYGAPMEFFHRYLSQIPAPDFVLISTGMTYWYLGVREVVDDIRRLYPGAKVVLGGIYSSILPDHAMKELEPDYIFTDLRSFLNFIGMDEHLEDISPLWDVYKKLDYGIIKLTDGCPFRCTYCAVWILSPRFKIRKIGRVLGEIKYFRNRGIRDIVFYDDALLVNPDHGILAMLDAVSGMNLRFHTPNALHARFISKEVAHAMKRAGFETIYIGYETSDSERQKKTGGKVTSEHFYNAIENLLSAGFKREQITVYLMMGLPGQPPEEVELGMREVAELGLKIMLSEYSPIPGTPDGERAREIIDIAEPLLQNNIVFPITYYGYDTVKKLKALKNRLNRQ